MFAWSANRVKPKMKATYTRKRLLNPSYQAGRGKSVPPPPETITILGEVDDGYDDGEDSIDIDAMDATPPSDIGSRNPRPLADNSTAADDKPSPSVDDSSVMANAANAQVLHETVITDREPSDDEQDREPSCDEQMDTYDMDEEDDRKKEEENKVFYDVDRFLADDYRKLPGMTAAQLVLLTKWAGFEKVSELTWEPESKMREDVPQIVEDYYAQKGIAPSHRPTKESNTTRGRGRPRKDDNALRGDPNKVSKSSRGRGRPRKTVTSEEVRSTTGRRGRPPKIHSSGEDQK